MGKLIALEVYDFKSYRGHHRLVFGDSYFTSIIGPNGSGKSNSMDAISFVLGIKSSHLRSAHLSELIYRGRVLKESTVDANGDAVEGAQNGDSEGNDHANHNPTTAWVMAQRWKRTITSAGQSEYRINNRVAENILIKARNFLVFQGDNPKDLTRLIEQISGSLDYKAEYEHEDQHHKLNQRRGINGEIRQYQMQKEELEKYENLRDERDEAIVTHRTIEDSAAEFQKRQEELKEFRRNDAQTEQAKVGREIKQKEKDAVEKENELVPIDEKLSTHQRVLANMEGERKTQQKSAAKMQNDLKTQEWREQQKQTGREVSAEDVKEYQRLRSEDQIKADEDAVSSLKSKAGSLEAELAMLQERRTELQDAMDSTSSQVDAKKNERERHNQRQRELEEKLVEVLRRLRDATDSQRESRKEAEQRETVAQLKRLFPGKKYEAAIWDSVVVDTEKAARDALDYLRDQRIGQMRFIPLDTIIHKQPNSNLRGMHQGMRLAIDRAMNFACGNTIVCETLQIARHLCYERHVDAKAVVLDGTVIHKGGNMTGGSEPSEKKRRFEESEVENLRVLKDKFQAEMSALPKGHKRQAEEEQLRSDLSGLEAKLKYAQEELAALERNIESKSKLLGHLKKQYDAQTQHSNAVKSVADEVFGDFCQYERLQGSLEQEADRKKLEFSRQISRLKNQLSFENERLATTTQRIEAERAKAKRDEATIEQLEAERKRIAAEEEELKSELEDLRESLAGLQKQHEQRGEKVNETRRQLQNRIKSVDKTVKEASNYQAEAQRASTERYGVLKRCQVENITIPLLSTSRALNELPSEDALIEDVDETVDLDESDATHCNDYGMHVDFSTLPEDLETDGSPDREASLLEQISLLTTSLEKLAPNMRSAERLAATSSRLQATDREFKQSTQASKRATKEFEAIKSRRQELFNKAYKHISQQITPIYKELTKTPHFPLGGSASLDIEDEVEPYLSGVKYHAMPPLKRFREMDSLSGGEKTMAALALLFAIHTFAPSPFFVLDEVDAALDVNNTQQLSAYLRAHAGPGMQFVVISLKQALFQDSASLVGVMKDQSANSSRAVTLDVSLHTPLLRKYQFG
ncbi:RecF/RecN/SMC protein [Piedraia hortae CBS 480.64]|uniref:RecF/RecN/SMC protein n=1 Tax=Piedraia hortae CBS 480.64 TaxID=1314780 RepID=A0A6A7C747_9PEZI|nr:RecF/RecN/SMC protein [Piedraia hortae CBS 480.64]